MKYKILMYSLAAALPATLSFAQKEGARPPGPRDGDRPERREGDRPGDKKGPPDGARRPGDRPPLPMPFLHALDADEDGIISAEEIKSAPDALKKLDKNADGKLTKEEWIPRPPQRDGDRPEGQRGERDRKKNPQEGAAKEPEKKANDWPFGKEKGKEQAAGKAGDQKAKPPGDRERPPRPPLLAALDKDGDEIISEDEIGAASESLTKLDLNKDGQLGPREYGHRPPPREGDKEAERPADKAAQ